MGNKHLYSTVTVPYKDMDEESIRKCMEKLKRLRKRHKDCQGLVARNVGINFDLCYMPIKDTWEFIVDLKVIGSGKKYTSSEGSYDCAGRFHVTRFKNCNYAGIKLVVEEDGHIIPVNITGKTEGNTARVFQRMYTDNHQEPIWVKGKKYMPFDPARFGFYKNK